MSGMLRDKKRRVRREECIEKRAGCELNFSRGGATRKGDEVLYHKGCIDKQLQKPLMASGLHNLRPVLGILRQIL